MDVRYEDSEEVVELLPPPDVSAGCRRRQESGTARVFWDIENCALPANVDVAVVVRNIRALRTSKGFTPSRIVAIATMATLDNLPVARREVLAKSGVDVVGCSATKAGKSSAADFRLLEEMHEWALTHPPPHSSRNCGVILISSDRDFSDRLSSLQKHGYDLMLVHNVKISDTLVAMVNQRKLWTDVCRAVPAALTSLKPNHPSVPALPKPTSSSGKVQYSSPTPTSRALVLQAKTAAVPQRSAPTSLAPAGPKLLAPGKKPDLDLFCVVGLLHWIDQGCFHLTPGHVYPDRITEGLIAMKANGLLLNSFPLGPNPPIQRVYLFLTARGQALLKLLRAVNLRTRKARHFRPAVYFWIQFAIANDSDRECYVSVLGDKIQPLFDGGTLTDALGQRFDSLMAYFSSAVSNGVFSSTEWQPSAYSLLVFQQPYSDYWREFKQYLYRVYPKEPWFEHAVCGRNVANSLVSTLAKYSDVEVRFLPVALSQLEKKRTGMRYHHLYHLGKMLGFSVGHRETSFAAERAGLVVGTGTSQIQLTARGKAIVERFEVAVGRVTK